MNSLIRVPVSFAAGKKRWVGRTIAFEYLVGVLLQDQAMVSAQPGQWPDCARERLNEFIDCYHGTEFFF